MQEQLKQQQATNLILQRLHQNHREQQMAAELAHSRVPEMRMNTELNMARFHNQHTLPLLSQRNKTTPLHGNPPSHHSVLESEFQNEVHNVLALQDEVQRKLLQRKRIDEEIRIANKISQQQALAIEMERQRQVQRNANAQLLSQYATIELATRQELLSRSLIDQQQVASNFRHPSTTIDGTNEIMRLRGMEAALSNQQSLAALNQRNSLNTAHALSHIMNQQEKQHVQHVPRPRTIMNVQSHGLNGLGGLSKHAFLTNSERRGIGISSRGKMTDNTIPKRSPINQTPNRFNSQRVEVLSDCSSDDSVRIVDSGKLPKIRYFNNGKEVNETGHKLILAKKQDEEIKVVQMKREVKDKKSKLQSNLSKDYGEKLPAVTSSRRISKFQVQRKLPMRKGIMSKLGKQKPLKRKEDEDSGDELIPSLKSKAMGAALKNRAEGPHHDLMVEYFPSSTNNVDKKKKKKEEDKMSAASALLGFSKTT